MRFNVEMTFRGQSPVSWIEKNKKSNRINVELDRYGNKSVLSFDLICFASFVQALNEYKEKGKVSDSCSESCRGQCDLDVFVLNLSEDKRFSVRFVLDDFHGGCALILRSTYAQVSVCLNGDQLKKIMEKFSNAVKAKEAWREAEKGIVVRSEGLRQCPFCGEEKTVKGMCRHIVAIHKVERVTVEDLESVERGDKTLKDLVDEKRKSEGDHEKI